MESLSGAGDDSWDSCQVEPLVSKEAGARYPRRPPGVNREPREY